MCLRKGLPEYLCTLSIMVSQKPYIFSRWGCQFPSTTFSKTGPNLLLSIFLETGITIPAILTEAKVAVTPMNGFTRFAGTMEIAGINHDINKVRVDAIADAAKGYYPDIQLTSEEKSNAACGLRPLSPDGLPFIGKSSKCNNLTIATGHAMMGWTMGTATGKLVSEIISEKKPSLELVNYHPDRAF